VALCAVGLYVLYWVIRSAITVGIKDALMESNRGSVAWTTDSNRATNGADRTVPLQCGICAGWRRLGQPPRVASAEVRCSRRGLTDPVLKPLWRVDRHRGFESQTLR